MVEDSRGIRLLTLSALRSLIGAGQRSHHRDPRMGNQDRRAARYTDFAYSARLAMCLFSKPWRPRAPGAPLIVGILSKARGFESIIAHHTLPRIVAEYSIVVQHNSLGLSATPDEPLVCGILLKRCYSTAYQFRRTLASPCVLTRRIRAPRCAGEYSARRCLRCLEV